MVHAARSQHKQNDASPSSRDIRSKEGLYDFDPHLVRLLKDKYIIESELGQGAQGKVYLGRCLADNQKVAIKVLRVNSVNDWKQYELFQREADVLKNLNVPGTARFYEAIQDLDSEEPMSLIVQEYIDGRSLQTYIDKNSYFSFDITCEILIRLYRVLMALHEQKPSIIHRDIKPSNVILRYRDGELAPEVFLIDFGAVANPQVQDGGSTVTGTYGYMAPEQLIGKPTIASDIYSFAVLSVYLFSGMPPEKIDTKDLRLLIDPHLEHLPHAVTVFLRQMLDPSPASRLVNDRVILKTLARFKKHKFSTKASYKKDKLQNYQLKDVKSLGQPGNIELWEALPDRTPRQVPSVYDGMLSDAYKLKDYNNIHVSLRKFEKYAIQSQNDDSLEGCYENAKIVLFSLFMVVYVCSGLVYILSLLLEHIGVLDIFSLPISVFIILYIVWMIWYFSSRSKKLEYASTIFVSGRKTLAVVESIELVQMDSHIFGKNRHKGEISKYRPLWRIVYFYNPPDDDSEDAVFNTYYSEVPPVLLKVGDTLPILYKLSQGKAYSIPYPLPPESSLYQCVNYMNWIRCR
ncbi:MAG: serine/threonine protein kinase [Proteobacteria bacterium]|nr:serine/threonine protein kinase [Pseudomonadota bacterium]